MPLTQINVGTTANDGTGDTVRAAFQLCNTAFTAVDARALLSGGNTFSGAQVITSGTITGLTDFGVAMANNTAMTGFALGTISDTTARPFLISQTFNNASLSGTALRVDITDTSSADLSPFFLITRGGSRFLSVSRKTSWGINNMPTIEGDGAAAGQVAFNSSHGSVILARKDGGWNWVANFGNAFAPSNSKLGFAANSHTGSVTTTCDAFWTRVAAAHIANGEPLASAWVDQKLSAAGAIVGTTSNGSPTNSFTITGSISTGTGTGGDLKFGVYGTNGASGTAIGTLNTVLTINAARKVLNVTGIPTSSAGLSAGDVYSNLGILTVV
jgi:hypothetical protein